MSDWERDANAALQALGETWQQGGISRDTYRARRRRLIVSLRARRDDTERKTLPTPTPAAPPADTDAVAVLGSRRGMQIPFRTLAVVAALVLAAFAAVLMMVFRGQGNV